MTAVFITATGTDIGKTYVAAGLIRHWRAAGRRVEALKPVATGFSPDTAAQSDPGLLLAALGRPAAQVEIEQVSPWRFAAPLSPDMAARREGRAIDFARLVGFCRRAIDARPEALLIEGIGGVMVPFDDKHTVLDLMAELGLPVLLVTGTYLGSLSHTLTACDVLLRRGLTVKALVVNETADSAVPLQETIATLRKFIEHIPMVGLTRAPTGECQSKPFAELAALL